ncbi:Flagellar radial spoke protein 3 [Diplonema papillatum]|nr:Flagellar radial spoke protein 3 [Diplonema papillatum]
MANAGGYQSGAAATVPPGPQGKGTYTFQQKPQGIGRGIYRDPAQTQHQGPINIHHDKRVVKGNTYAAQVLPLSAQMELQMAQKESERQKRKIAAEHKKKKQQEAKRSLTPEAVEGRRHIDMQTEQYLEELTDRIEEATAETQTDPMLDRPPTPRFVPSKSGRDAECQVEDGDLFDFDFEVQPILEVIVGKTMEQAMLEVMQEEELESMRQQQLEYEQRRKEEAVETQRLEAAEKRKYQEKERRKKQEQERLRREKATQEKLAARVFAKQFLQNTESKVFGQLDDEGWFYDSIEREVETSFMPWLHSAVESQLNGMRKTQSVVDDLVKAALEKAHARSSKQAGS